MSEGDSHLTYMIPIALTAEFALEAGGGRSQVLRPRAGNCRRSVRAKLPRLVEHSAPAPQVAGR